MPVEKSSKVGFIEDVIILPNGLLVDGIIEKEVVMNEMTGEDEALFGSPDFKQRPGKVLSKLLYRTIESIGGIKPSPLQILELLTGDREYLLMKLRQLTLGDEVTFETICPIDDCHAKEERTFLISDIPIIQGTGERVLDIELEKGYEDKEGKVHTSLRLRLANGADQEVLTPQLKKNPFEAAAILLNCRIVALGTLAAVELEKYRSSIALKLKKSDRLLIDELEFNAYVGPDTTLECSCSECGNTFEIPFPFESFFIKRPRKFQRKQI